MDLEFYENPAFFDTLHRAQVEGPFRPAKIVNDLLNLGQSGVSLIAVTGLLVSFHWAVPLFLFIAVLPGVLAKIKYSGVLYKWQRQRTGTQRKSGYLNWLITGYAHAKELRMFGLGNLFAEEFSNLRKILRGEKLDISRKRAFADILSQVPSIAAVFGALGFIVYRAVQGLISIGSLVMYYQAIQRGLEFFKGVLTGLAELYEDNLFISYFYEFLDFKEKIKDPDHPLQVPKKMQKGIFFDNVSFSYPSSNKKVLENITFSIRPGEIVALVGENGAGKSTIAKILCRLYDPDSGTVYLDQKDFRKYAVRELRGKIGMMFQDFAQYHFTARKNIWIGNTKVPYESREVEYAAQKADADQLIQNLPEGYDTVLGKMFEKGEELSVGQWQKIAIARAFMQKSELIVLDEPASSLDAESEYDIFQNFKKLMHGKSAVLISHRFSTVKMADKIIVLKKGKIIERGSHSSLLKKKGHYAQWFEKQSIVAGAEHMVGVKK
jgi:ATP-binding cassette subfamily B protein